MSIPRNLSILADNASSTGILAVAGGGTGAATTTANLIFSGPSSGAPAAPTFRALTTADIPSLAYVTSVALALPSIMSVTGSPVTSSGTLTGALTTQAANAIFAGPSSGAAAAPTFRSLTTADIPTLNQNTTGTAANVTGTVAVANGGTGLTTGTSGGILYYSAAGTLASSAALAANAIVLGGGAGVTPATTTTGTGVVTALGVNTGTAGAFVVNGGALGTPSSGTLSSTTVDGTNGVGYINIPQNAQTGSYTLVAGDAGKHIYHAAAAAAATYTIPANASVAYVIGTAVTFINMSTNNVTVAITTDTMYLGGTGTTGSRTLAQYGVATAVKMTSTTWVITGSGLT